MNNMTQETISNDEVNLLHYWRVIRKRKQLLIGVFLVITIGTAVVNLFLPKIYRGEFILKMAAKDFTDVFKTIKVNDTEVMQNIFPKTNQLINDIRLTTLLDTAVCKIDLLIDAKDTTDIPKIKAELLEYINNFPFHKNFVEQRKERMQKEIDEISKAIAYTDDLLKSGNDQKQNSPEYDPVRLYNGKINLANKKIVSEQSLKNYTGIETIMENIYSTPIKPTVKNNIILSALIGILSGVFMVFIAELKDKVRRPVQNKQEQ
ncbi:MAG: hypothetical protein EPN85_08490 [Bacteroidetes bacterium]|nr:MAG: hypothetical protein EPN85_08490 [Bacteroidota bacterium]